MIAIIYTSLVALVQEDIKKLIAYSSVAHMGFVTMGLFSLNTQGIQGAMFLMISHGFVSGALFLCVGVIYDRMHTREICRLWRSRQAHAALCLRLHGLHPGQCRPCPAPRASSANSSALVGAFKANSWVALLATSGVILSAAYALYLYRRVIFGALDKASLASDRRSDRRARWSAIFPLFAGIDDLLWRLSGTEFSKLATALPSRIFSAHDSRCFARVRMPPPANDGAFRKMHFFHACSRITFLPEVILAIGVLALILVGALARASARISLVTELTVAVLGLALLAILSVDEIRRRCVFDGAYIDDAFWPLREGLGAFASLVDDLLSS